MSAVVMGDRWRLPDDLFRISVWRHPPSGATGLAAALRHTRSGWLTQPSRFFRTALEHRAHVAASARVGAAQPACEDQVQQTWIRRPISEPNAERMLGQFARVFQLSMAKASCHRRAKGVAISECTSDDVPELVALAERSRGRTYVEAEELADPDVGQDALDERFARAGLRRYRRVHFARIPRREEAVGAAIAYRGPRGFTPNLIENRIDLLLDPCLTDAQVVAVCIALVQHAARSNEDADLPNLPVFTSERGADALSILGARLTGTFAQAAWFRPGYSMLSDLIPGVEVAAPLIQRATVRLPPRAVHRLRTLTR